MKDINVILGERIKLGRKANNLTQEKLAELIDVSPRFLAGVEAGKTGVSLQTLKNLCVALSTTADFLLGLTDNKNDNYSEQFVNKLSTIDTKYYPLILTLINELNKI